MSRKYMNDRWCVRCGRESPTPYLKKHLFDLVPDLLVLGFGPPNICALDIGCGNGRNCVYLRAHGIECEGLDMCPPSKPWYKAHALGRETFPTKTGSVSVILANYVLMFLDDAERQLVYREIARVGAPGCRIMVELYPAKDSFFTTDAALAKLEKEIIGAFECVLIHQIKNRMILELK